MQFDLAIDIQLAINIVLKSIHYDRLSFLKDNL